MEYSFHKKKIIIIRPPEYWSPIRPNRVFLELLIIILTVKKKGDLLQFLSFYYFWNNRCLSGNEPLETPEEKTLQGSSRDSCWFYLFFVILFRVKAWGPLAEGVSPLGECLLLSYRCFIFCWPFFRPCSLSSGCFMAPSSSVSVFQSQLLTVH